jgi:hypothetical protein
MTDTADTQSTTEDVATENTSSTEDIEATQRVPDNPATPPTGDKTALLQELVATIRASVAPGVTPEARAAGAAACRAILAALETQVGQPLVAMTPVPTATQATPELTSPLARVLSQLVAMPREQLTGLMRQLAAMPREQLIDFLINRLRSALPPGTQTRVSAGPRFHLIEIPQVGKVGGRP